jgi:iron complex outermembrane receptor protein
MIGRGLLIGSASLFALAVGTAPASAQTDPTAPAATDSAVQGTEQGSTSDDETIVVTGIRGSLRASVDAKRQSDQVADYLSAEDIGQFPDRNVAEALQRVPGIVINREFGEGERVSLRGTAPNLTRTLVDGHAIATADWFVLEQLAATRSFNYLTLPSEIVARLDVFKSPTADLDEGGVGGTINVHTRVPLGLDPFTVSASAEMVYSELRDSLDPQASGLVSWHNASGTFGVLVGGVYQRRDIRRDGVEVLGYTTNAATGTALIPSLIGSALFVQERERYGGNIAVQFRPTDQLEITLTGLYSRFGADNFNQNYLAWGSQALGGGGTITNFNIQNGTVVSGRITSTPGGRAVVFDAIDRQAFAETWAGNADITWHPSDRGTFHLMGGYTEAHGDTTSQPFFEGGAPGAFTYDLTGRTPQVTFIGVDPTDPNDLVFDFGSLHQITNTDRELYFFADYEHEVEWGPVNALRFGAKYTDHDRITVFDATTYGGFFLPLLATGCNGPCDPADFFTGNLTPGNFLEHVAEPGTLTSYWQVDRRTLENIYFGLPASVRARVINPPENYSINEKTYGGYAMIRFGGDNWRGNAGLRVVRTDQTSVGNILGVPASTPGAVTTNPFGVFLPTTVDRSYTDILPSMNVAFDLTPQLVLRLAAARVMARPDYTDIVPRVNLNPGSLTAAGGDPSVDPFRANQFDASLEWYPDRETLIAGALYYKDIRSYITDTITQERFPVQTATPNLSRCTLINAAQNLYDCLFDVNRRANGPGGRNIGFEIQAQRRIWGPFGAVVNYTFSDADSDNGDPIPGNSRHSLNVSGYFENDMLSARLSYNYRSSFFITFDRAVPLNQAATESLDASLNFRINDNISLTADAINLTNEKIVQFSSVPDRPRAIYDNGRQFYFGVRVRY